MKILKKQYLVYLLLWPFLFLNSEKIQGASVEESNAFRSISLTTAKELAAKEGKKIFLEFYASWCVPCKWMEETTLTDSRVQRSLKEDYIAIKVDIDDFDGYAIKEYYQVKVLPTIIIVDEKGLAITRKEQSLSAEMLLDVLGSKNKQWKEQPVNSSPTALAKTGDYFDNINPEREIENKEAIVKTSYRVQVGVFTDYANTQRYVDELNEMTGEPVVILNDKLNDKLVYKVLLGDFELRHEAENFKNHLRQNYGIDSYVK